MQPREMWPDDPVFIEVGINDPALAHGLCRVGYTKYLGVSDKRGFSEQLRKANSEIADRITFSDQPRLVLHNNAEVLVLSGWKRLFVWRFRYTRHAKSVAWRINFNPLGWMALLGCLMHVLLKHYALPRLVTMRSHDGKNLRLLVSLVRRRNSVIVMRFISYRTREV